ncbi:hypothetical protein EDC01DRAFT_637004 [Geopyxis carbonaria]|nr:hypothetical protein EDC01DRAFT_637004 [Geopyxis carbonaria]
MSTVIISNDCFQTYISTLLEITEKEVQTPYLNIFKSILLGMESFELSASFSSWEIECDLLHFSRTIAEPSQGAVGFCVGQLCDSLATKGKAAATRVVPAQFFELPGNPSDDDFESPADAPAYVNSVGIVIPTIKGAMRLPPGYKFFDLSSAFYDSISKKKENFNMRWIYPNVQRFANFQIPKQGTVVQVSGKLLGRINSTFPMEQMLGCYIDNIEWIGRPPQASGGSPSIKKEPGTSGSSTVDKSSWRKRQKSKVDSSDRKGKRPRVVHTPPPIGDNIAFPAGLTPSSAGRVQPLLDDVTTPCRAGPSSRAMSYTDLIADDESPELVYLTKEQVRDLHDGLDPADTGKHI